MKTIKNLKLIVLVTLVFLVTYSCKSDDDDSGINNTEQNRQNLIGTWKITGETENGEEQELWICDLLETITFTVNTVTTKSFYDQSGTNGSNCVLDGNYTQNYTLSGAIITIIEDGESFSGEITKLTSSILKVKFENEYDGETYIEITTYEKQ